MSRPLCFILMPFGRKPDASGVVIDFDAVYQDLIAPAIAMADMDPLRADDEITGGIIHKPLFERLILCEYAVADLTTANASVFYELGVRHAVRPWSTILLFSKGGSQLPFDLAPLRALPYILGADGCPVDTDQTRTVIATRLHEARQARTDSPIYQLVENYPAIDHTKTDVFREQVRYSSKMKIRLATARREGIDKLREIERELAPIQDAESGVVIDLFLSYRAVKAWDDMISLVGKMHGPLAATVMVREQQAFASNRAGHSQDAERVLLELIDQRGPSSETCGLLGRVYKDRWETARKAGRTILAQGLIEKAIEAYLRGFETDWRDAYPGINAATLMELKDPPDDRRHKIIPVVTYAVERKIGAGKPDYWDHATLLELAVLAMDEGAARQALANAAAVVREEWEPETTSRNLRLIRDARERRKQGRPWMIHIEDALAQMHPQNRAVEARMEHPSVQGTEGRKQSVAKPRVAPEKGEAPG